MIDFDTIIGFDWDETNVRKIREKHNVQRVEAEQVFNDEHVMIFDDVRHSDKEERFHAMGRTEEGRFLLISFTLRDKETRIRIISARPMSKRERQCYD